MSTVLEAGKYVWINKLIKYWINLKRREIGSKELVSLLRVALLSLINRSLVSRSWAIRGQILHDS